MKARKSLRRALPSKATRSERMATSSGVGCGKRVITHPNNESNGKAKAPIRAGIQNSLTCKPSITKSPNDFAVPELAAMLRPIRAANKSVTRRPSRKLNITPHMQPSERPLKNKSKTLKGRGSNPNNTKNSSATATEPIIKEGDWIFASRKSP